MGFYEPGTFVDSFEPDDDGNLQARREAVYGTVEVGQVVSVECDDLATFVRVLSIEGHPESGIVVLRELVGTDWDQASEDLELSYEGWCYSPQRLKAALDSGGLHSWAEHGVEVGERPLDEDGPGERD